jgi:hypothetical protein
MNKLKSFLKDKLVSVQKLTNFRVDQIESFESRDDNTITLYDISHRKIVCQYEVIGMYHEQYKIWSWAHSLDFLNKNKYKLSSDMTERFQNVHINDLEMSDFLFFCFKNNNFYIQKKRLNLLLQYIIFILNSMWIYPIPSEQNPNIHIYLVLNNILKY